TWRACRWYLSRSVRAAISYMRSRQVPNVPGSACVMPRSARWKACECALANPGRVRPGRRSAADEAEGTDGAAAAGGAEGADGAEEVTEVKRSPWASMR